MTKRALLIGSQTYGLAGVNGDIELMQDALQRRGFEVRAQLDDDATRAAIIEGYERLIYETPEGSTDPIVVYYSGHGGHTPMAEWADLQPEARRSHIRYLVPFDMAATTETDFRGLLSEELTFLQRRLSARCENVTTILDCCYSGTMSRDPDVMPKSVPRSFPFEAALPLMADLAATRAPGLALDDSSPLAVRLVACNPLQSAYERASILGGRHGALTEQLVLALRDLGDRPVTWRVLVDRLRRAITLTLPQQPEVEGPADRLLFSLITRDTAGALPVAWTDGTPRIEAAHLFGVSVGDRYELRDTDDVPLRQAEVASIDGDSAVLAIAGDGASPGLVEGVTAVPVRTTRTTAVRLLLPEGVWEDVAEKLGESASLHLAAEDETAVARIVDDGGLAVIDGDGYLVQTERFSADATGITGAVALAERVAKAERLRSLERGDDELLRMVEVMLHSHDHNGSRSRATIGERLYPGEHISYQVTNWSSQTLYIGLVDIDTAYQIRLINDDEPDGWVVPPGQTKTVGGPYGSPLEWDTGVPEDGERRETLFTIASTTPQQFRVLTSVGGSVSREGAEPPNGLDSSLEEADTGTRGWLAEGSRAFSYCAKSIDFYLVPATKPDEPAFAINEVPDIWSRSLRSRTAVVPPPARLAVRLVSLSVRESKTLFNAVIRVDALILTGSNGHVVATPFTARLPRIADGDLLPADNLLLYHGEVDGFLDIAIWVNRDETKAPDLGTLFEEVVRDSDVQRALTVIEGLVVADRPAVAAAASVSAVATVVRVGASLVSTAVGEEIGLYRTTFLPFEQFGLGRQPREGLRTAMGIEFAYEIVEPDVQRLPASKTGSSVFVSYSHRDKRWLERLQVHLRPLEREFGIDIWDDTKIQIGAQWRDEIRQAISNASVAILLISADFVGSDFITQNELPPLLKAAAREGTVILPLIVGYSMFSRIDGLSRFQAVNSPDSPLADQSRPRAERVLQHVANRVLDVLQP